MKQLSLIIINISISILFPLAGLASPKIDYSDSLNQITNVNQLRDVSPTDWSYEVLRSLSDRTSCITGFSDNTYRGSKALTRYEFAAGLNSCLNQIEKSIAEGKSLSSRDTATLRRLSQDFAAELATLNAEVEALENKVAKLEGDRFLNGAGDIKAAGNPQPRALANAPASRRDFEARASVSLMGERTCPHLTPNKGFSRMCALHRFSTTTKLTGQVIFAANAGGFDGDRIIAPRGALISETDPQPTFIYRAVLFFNTSFRGTDQLQIRLLTGSNGANDNAGGFLEPNFGSTLDYTVQGRDSLLSLGRAFYQFSPYKDLNLIIGPAIVITDYVDGNNLAGASFRDFSTLAFANNFVLFPNSAGGGAVAEWNPQKPNLWKLR